MQRSCHWPGSFIISNTGGWQGQLHSGGDRQQICNKHLAYLFNVFFMFLELLRTALNISIDFSYVSIYASHFGTYWKPRLYFSVLLPPLRASKPDAEFWTSKQLAERKLGQQPLEVVITCSPYDGHCERAEDVTAWGWLNAKTGMPRDNLEPKTVDSSHTLYVVLLLFGVASVLLLASYVQPSR